MKKGIPVIACAGLYWILCCLFCVALYTLSTRNAYCQTATSVVVWGANAYGETNVPTGLTNVVGIASTVHSCEALKADGTVVGWGNDDYGIPLDLTNAVAIAAGGDFALALKADGTVVAWGPDSDGAIDIPSGLSNVVAIAACSYVGMALRNDGSVVAWGNPDYEQTNVPANLSNVVAIAVGGNASLALSANGQVTVWGEMTNLPPGLSNVVSIAAGDDFYLAATSDGNVVAWGNLYDGLLSATDIYSVTNVPSDLTNVATVAAAGETVAQDAQAVAMALNLNNTITVWGDDSTWMTNITQGLTNVVAITAGYDEMALLGGRSPVTWPMVSQFAYSGTGTLILEANGLGEFPLSYQWQFDGTNISGANLPWLVLTNVEDANSGNYTVVISNAFGIASNTVPSVIADSPPIILQQPQSLELPPNNNFTFSVNATGSQPMCYQWQFNGTNIPGANGPSFTVNNAQLPAAGYYSVVLKNAYGTLVSSNAGLSFSISSIATWGDNHEGELNMPTNLTDVTAIAAGAFQSLALLANGTVVGWGFFAQTIPPGLTNVVAISSGYAFDVALKGDGTVVEWADENYSELDVPPGLSNVVAIAAGQDAIMALQSNGMVFTWGDLDGTNDDANVPASVSNVVSIAASAMDWLALRSDGTVVEWGDDSYGQIEYAATLTNIIALGTSPFSEGESMAVRADGTVVVWGNVPSYLEPPPGLSNVVAVASGTLWSIAMLANHTAVVWGLNSFNVLNIPPGLTNIVSIGAGEYFGLVLDPAGGVITLEPSGVSGQNQVGYLQATLAPPGAVSAGGGWGIVGQPYFSSSTNFTVAVSSGESVALAFQSVNGWNVPTSRAVVVPMGGLTNLAISYAVEPPVMSAIPGTGFGISGTTNTTYRIQYSTNVANGQWLTLSTNTLGEGFNKIAPWPPANHAPATYYRAVWLP